MEDQENHIFSSFDFFTLVLCLAVIVGVSAPIIKNNFRPDNSLEMAKRELNQIGQAILNPGTLNLLARNSSGKSERSVASVDGKAMVSVPDLDSIQRHLKDGEWEGEIGKDPWGNPYHFAFLRNSSGVHTHVAVWSNGPDQKSDTSPLGQMANSQSGETLSFKGDDVGSIFPIR